MASGVPADSVLFDIHAPPLIDATQLITESINSAVARRRMRGAVLMAVVGGRMVNQNNRIRVNITNWR